MSGTDLGYAATRSGEPRQRKSELRCCPIRLRACYAKPGTHAAYGPIRLGGACYAAVSGTEIGYGAQLKKSRGPSETGTPRPVCPPILLPASYAISGTEMALAVPCPVLRYDLLCHVWY
eukprot:42177-Rhodomonas_salina.1